MKTSRRQLLLAGVSGLLAPWLGKAHALTLSTAASNNPLASLPYYLESLLPAEGALPGGLEVGVPGALLEKAYTIPAYERLLQNGGRWLEREARQSYRATFSALSEGQREKIVEKAERSPPGSLPRVFFQRTRVDAFEIYYSHPQVWAALGFDGPPQPLGYPDFANPPEADTPGN